MKIESLPPVLTAIANYVTRCAPHCAGPTAARHELNGVNGGLYPRANRSFYHRSKSIPYYYLLIAKANGSNDGNPDKS